MILSPCWYPYISAFSQILLTSLGIPEDIRKISSIALRLNSSRSPTPAYFKWDLIYLLVSVRSKCGRTQLISILCLTASYLFNRSLSSHNSVCPTRISVFVISQNVHDMILLASKHWSFYCPYSSWISLPWLVYYPYQQKRKGSRDLPARSSSGTKVLQPYILYQFIPV